MARLGPPPRKSKASSADGLTVELDGASVRSWNLFGQYDERARKLQQMVPYIAAQETFRGLMGRIPSDRRWKTYRSVLRVVRIGPKEWRGGVFAVYGKPKVAGSRLIDSSRTVLYVRVKQNRVTPPGPLTRILAKFSPWTMETLPFAPKRSEALVVTRQVSKREVQRVSELRKDDEQEWMPLLRQAGVNHIRRDPTDTELKAKQVQDVAFEALRLEFGYGGTKPVPHWRPSVKEAVQVVTRLWKTKNRLTRHMLNYKDRAWKKWPPQVGSARIADLKNMAKFQKRLRVRV